MGQPPEIEGRDQGGIELSTENAREMLLKAELALADGNFIRARHIAKTASSLLDKTQSLHRMFMDKMKDFMTRIRDMEGKGYDVSEAVKIMEKARGRALKSDYDIAISTITKIEPALDRATYLPFPLLNKMLDIISIIFYKDGKISYTVRIENPMSDPLGEIIIKPFLSEKDFHDVGERYFGVIGPKEYKESTFILTPKKEDWALGVGREVLMGEGIVLRTRLSSKGGTAKYFITIENNSDQIIRDISVSPMAPGGLESDPPQSLIEVVEPFAQKTVEFDLFPATIYHRDEEPVKEKVIAVEEELVITEVDIDLDDEEDEEEEWGEDVIDEEPQGEIDESGLDLDTVDDDISELSEGPRDFTPVDEEYNLISMVPPRYPEEIEMELKMQKRKPRRNE